MTNNHRFSPLSHNPHELAGRVEDLTRLMDGLIEASERTADQLCGGNMLGAQDTRRLAKKLRAEFDKKCKGKGKGGEG